MATVKLGGNLSSAFTPSQLAHKSRIISFHFLKLNASFAKQTLTRSFAAKFSVSSSSSSSSSATLSATADFDKTNKDEKNSNSLESSLACPVCYESLVHNADSALSVDSAAGTRLQCSSCKKRYFGNDTHLDLTVANNTKAYGENNAASTEIFRLPLVSYFYERGWRQSFDFWGGFPGPEMEFQLIKDYIKPVLGGNIIDASCGSGLFARLFAKSGLFSGVVALDYSETMLQQCYEFIKLEPNFPKEKLGLVRADISRLPFASSSVDAVHAGAALHCWPSPSAAVAEISRVLRPGGIFVATTYILDGLFSLVPLIGPLRQNFAQISGSHVFLSEEELEDLCKSCGLVGFKCTRNRRFVMISAVKP